jgi:hypothetical protein
MLAAALGPGAVEAALGYAKAATAAAPQINADLAPIPNLPAQAEVCNWHKEQYKCMTLSCDGRFTSTKPKTLSDRPGDHANVREACGVPELGHRS